MFYIPHTEYEQHNTTNGKENSATAMKLI